jgi:hypothetical protein
MMQPFEPPGELMALLELRPRCEGIEGIRGGDAAPTGVTGSVKSAQCQTNHFGDRARSRAVA